MHHTIGYILSKETDFKTCLECGSINWYENTECQNCNAKKFRKLDESDKDFLKQEYKCDEENCECYMECEIDT